MGSFTRLYIWYETQTDNETEQHKQELQSDVPLTGYDIFAYLISKLIGHKIIILLWQQIYIHYKQCKMNYHECLMQKVYMQYYDNFNRTTLKEGPPKLT